MWDFREEGVHQILILFLLSLFFFVRTYFSLQIVDLALILKDPVPSKAEDADEEFAGDRWDSEEQKEDEEDPFWK